VYDPIVDVAIENPHEVQGMIVERINFYTAADRLSELGGLFVSNNILAILVVQLHIPWREEWNEMN
jgi:hypothetical protein